MNIRTFIIPSTLLAATLLAAPALAAGGEPQDGTTLKPVRAVVERYPYLTEDRNDAI